MSISKYDKNDSKKNSFTIGEISRMYQICTDSLRYYEKKGVISPRRDQNGYRMYDSDNIWRMNVIMNLRSLGFSVDEIAEYIKTRTVASTIDLLNKELNIIQRSEQKLEELKKQLNVYMNVISEAQNLMVGKIDIKEIPQRNVYRITENFSSDEHMDLLMKGLVEKSERHIHLIGNNHTAAILSEDNSEYTYSGALIFDEHGDDVLPQGKYLSICYSGKWNTRKYADILTQYGQMHNLPIIKPFIDIIWIETHTSSEVNEYRGEVQVHIDL
jgi:DNA-binding transcriptional MerR regulator